MGILEALGLKSEPKKDPMHITDDNYKTEVLNSDIPVLLDVWSFGCAPCVALAPTMMKLAAKYEGRVKIAEINAGQNPATMGKLNVRGTPTVVVFKKGKIIGSVVGMRGQSYYEEMIEAELLQKPAEAENRV